MDYQLNKQDCDTTAAMSAFEMRKVRDVENATRFRVAATLQLTELVGSGLNGITEVFNVTQAQHKDREIRSVRAIALQSFSVMLEVEVEDRAGNTKKWLWYGSEGIEVNMPLRAAVMPSNSAIAILAWTHPGLQVGLAESLGDSGDLWDSGLKIVAVTPEGRARFQQVLPELVGLYEPGGSVGRRVDPTKARQTAGLKSVKLDMTSEQVKAFIGPMSGILLVTGAPGSGKTTVAMQRVRYLLDQQDQRVERAAEGVRYDIPGIKIFLANRNLVQHTRNLLREELGIPDSVVHMVPEFIGAYVSDAWEFPLGARPSAKKYRPIDIRAREALFSRCDGSDLKKGWQVYVRQIAKRLVEKRPMTWLSTSQSSAHAKPLIAEIKAYVKADPGTDSRLSESYFSMGRLYRQVGATYEKVRVSLPSGRQREEFEERFSKWLYYVYDPIDCLRSVVEESRSRARNRVERATAGRADGSSTIKEVIGELRDRVYGGESLGWIAFLLRFALPTEGDLGRRFRRVPYAFETIGSVPTHIAIDEAQDLSAPEAAFLASLADERGALTISADFRQRVSPSKGIGDVEALQIGALVPSDRIDEKFRFTKNMRQSFELTQFLRAYYEVSFGEVPHFEVSEKADRAAKPQLLIGNDSSFARRLKTLQNVLTRARSAGTVAVLQVNTDPTQRDWARQVLKDLDIPIVDGAGLRQPGAWTLASVEEIKGLEYETCVVLGLDDIDAAELDNFRNRAYVAISRPTRRLLMLCNEFPSVLRGIPDSLYDRVAA